MKARACAILTVAAAIFLAEYSNAWAQTQPTELVVAAWGGKFKEGWDKSLIPDFERRYGVKIVWSVGQNSGGTLAKILAQKDNPQIDVALLDVGPHSQAVALGLVEKLDLARLPNSKDLYDLAFEPDNYGINFAISGTGLIYNTKVFGASNWQPLTSWLDLFRPELKGRIAVHSVRSSSGVDLLLAFSRMGGGGERNVDPGFAKLKELKPSLLTIVISGNELAPLLQQEEIVASSLSIDDYSTMVAKGLPVKFVWPKEGSYGFNETATIVKGRPPASQDLAYKFIDMLLSKEEQENSAKYIGFGPLNKTVELPPDIAEKVVYGADTLKRLNATNWPIVNQSRAAWIDRWSKEIEGR
jgi:putative spermidine/putrescine transport system substrate-binding protein